MIAQRRFPRRPALIGITIRAMPVFPARCASRLITCAIMALVTISAQQPENAPAKVALYAGVGEELITFDVDVERSSLTRRSSLTLPGFVQEAWASAGSPFIYVAWSNGGSSYAGSGVEPRGDRHGVTAFHIEGGALRQQGAPAALRSRDRKSVV